MMKDREPGREHGRCEDFEGQVEELSTFQTSVDGPTKVYGGKDLTPPEGYVRIKGLLIKTDDSASKAN